MPSLIYFGQLQKQYFCSKLRCQQKPQRTYLQMRIWETTWGIFPCSLSQIKEKINYERPKIGVIPECMRYPGLMISSGKARMKSGLLLGRQNLEILPKCTTWAKSINQNVLLAKMLHSATSVFHWFFHDHKNFNPAWAKASHHCPKNGFRSFFRQYLAVPKDTLSDVAEWFYLNSHSRVSAM